jgi:hypothetical protein
MLGVVFAAAFAFEMYVLLSAIATGAGKHDTECFTAATTT